MKNVIAQSWRRSELSGVDPARFEPRQVDVNTDTVLVRTVKEVLTPTLHHLADSGMSVGLTDADGKVVWRWAENNHILNLMDESRVAVGFDFAEASVGTNGAGTVLESGMPVMIGSGEHYAEALKRFACFAAPVVHPVTGHRMGVLSLSCEAGHETPLMRAMVMQYAAHVGQALLAAQTESRRMLLDQFARAARVRRTPVIAVSPDVLLCDRRAARLQLDHQTLWDHVRDFTSESDIIVPDSDGIVARVEPMLSQGQTIGSLLVLRSEPGMRPVAEITADPIQADVSWNGLTRRVTEMLSHTGRFLLWGEPATGKAMLLRGVLDLDARDVFDLDPAAGSTAEQVHRMRSALREHPRRLGVVHLDRASRHAVADLAEVLADAADQGVLLGATAGAHPRTEAVDSAIADQFDGSVLEVPPLRERRDEIAGDISAISQALYGDRARSFSADALQALRRGVWADNYKQLHHVVSTLARPIEDENPPVEMGELPHEFQVSRRVLTPLESAEAAAVARTLRDAGGNKKRAAELLGISRGALYAKIRRYRIADDTI